MKSHSFHVLFSLAITYSKFELDLLLNSIRSGNNEAETQNIRTNEATDGNALSARTPTQGSSSTVVASSENDQFALAGKPPDHRNNLCLNENGLAVGNGLSVPNNQASESNGMANGLHIFDSSKFSHSVHILIDI